MTKTKYGLIAGLAGAAAAFTGWWRRRPDRLTQGMSTASHSRTTQQQRERKGPGPKPGAMI